MIVLYLDMELIFVPIANLSCCAMYAIQETGQSQTIFPAVLPNTKHQSKTTHADYRMLSV